MLTLEKITWENFNEVISLTVSDTQKAYTQPNTVFIAQGYVNLSSNYLNTLKAITLDNVTIGFVKWVDVPKDVKPYDLQEHVTMIDAFMIDQKYQGKGLGRKTLKLVIEAIKKDVRYQGHSICLLCHKENTIAQHFFQSNDFIPLMKSYESNGKTYLWYKHNQKP